MFFYFSSKRRHTTLTCDWSSDVCSSDLPFGIPAIVIARPTTAGMPKGSAQRHGAPGSRPAGTVIKYMSETAALTPPLRRPARSEERRVGKERRTRGSTTPQKKKGERDVR